MKNLLCRAGIVLALMLGVAPVQAQTAAHSKRPSLAQSLTGAAKDAFTSAGLLLNNDDYAGALEKYQQAYELSKEPRLLLNMAICARSLKAYARMQSLLLRYEREAGASMSEPEKQQADAALAAIRNLVGTLRVTVSESGATVTLDGQAVGTTPLEAPLVVDLGSHAFHVEKPGFTPFEQNLTIDGGNETPVTVTLKAIRHVAQLVVVADDGATVAVDGEIPAKGRFDAQITPGVHEVRVTESGKNAFRSEVDSRDGETRTLQVTLEDVKHSSPVWPWIVGERSSRPGPRSAGTSCSGRRRRAPPRLRPECSGRQR